VEIGRDCIVAPQETVTTAREFSEAFTHRRCLVPADSFYERDKLIPKPGPHRIMLKSSEPFAFAGLWEHWENGEGHKITSCAIITCEANDVVRRIHQRMPVILPPEIYDAWLSGNAGTEVLKPFPSNLMKTYR